MMENIDFGKYEAELQKLKSDWKRFQSLGFCSPFRLIDAIRAMRDTYNRGVKSGLTEDEMNTIVEECANSPYTLDYLIDRELEKREAINK